MSGIRPVRTPLGTPLPPYLLVHKTIVDFSNVMLGAGCSIGRTPYKLENIDCESVKPSNL